MFPAQLTQFSSLPSLEPGQCCKVASGPTAKASTRSPVRAAATTPSVGRLPPNEVGRLQAPASKRQRQSAVSDPTTNASMRPLGEETAAGSQKSTEPPSVDSFQFAPSSVEVHTCSSLSTWSTPKTSIRVPLARETAARPLVAMLPPKSRATHSPEGAGE